MIFVQILLQKMVFPHHLSKNIHTNCLIYKNNVSLWLKMIQFKTNQYYQLKTNLL